MADCGWVGVGVARVAIMGHGWLRVVDGGWLGWEIRPDEMPVLCDAMICPCYPRCYVLYATYAMYVPPVCAGGCVGDDKGSDRE